MKAPRVRSLVAPFVIAVVVASCASASPTAVPSPEASPTPANEPSANPTVEATATPDGGPPAGDLPPGSYRANFQPAFTFTLGPGWARGIPDAEVSDSYLQLLYAAGDGGELLFIERSDLGVEASLMRFDQFRFKEVEPGVPATIGGVTGVAIAGGHPPAVAVVRGIPRGSEYVLDPSDRIRATAVEVDGVTLTFIVEATDKDFEAFVLLADAVLGTVAFP